MENAFIPQDGSVSSTKLLKKIPDDILKIVIEEQARTSEKKGKDVSWTETLYKMVRQWNQERIRRTASLDRLERLTR